MNKYLEHSNAYFPVFYANNLPEELPSCTAWGPGYGHICIESVEKINAELHE